MVSEWVRESFPRTPAHPSERIGSGGTEDGRFKTETQDSQRRQPPLTILDALRQHCGIPAKRVFLAVIMEDGSPMTFGGLDARLDESLITQFFDMVNFRRVMEHLEATSKSSTSERLGLEGSFFRQPMDMSRSRMLDRRRLSGFDEYETPARQGRKRMRARAPVDEDDIPMAIATTRKGIKIGNTEDLWNFYEQRFKNCQQSACKLMAKAWVKAVEPKKQSTHPYTGSDMKAPEWWPKPWGPTKEDRVRHKEPDHLYKRERVHLLAHILRLVMEPTERQHADVKKLNLNIKKLEEITVEALSPFFTDKENPANAKKKPYINEIFRVAKQEERFKKGEIDGTLEVYVMTDEKFPAAYASENDDGSMSREDEEQEYTPMKTSVAHSLMPMSTADHGSVTGLHASPFMSDLPVRGSQYPPPMMQGLAPPQHGFIETQVHPTHSQLPAQVHATSGNLALDMGVPSPHDASRRPSNAPFTTAPDYGGNGGSGLYAQQWQTGSTAPNPSAMYTFAQQHGNAPQASFNTQPIPLTQPHPYIPSFDGLARNGYAGGVPSQPVVGPSPGYGYAAHDGRGLVGIKADPASHTSMQ